jgi:hypothetical protein
MWDTIRNVNGVPTKMKYLKDSICIKGEILSKDGQPLDKSEIILKFKEWLVSQDLSFGGVLGYYATNDESQARFDISHDCANFRNQQTEIKVAREWHRTLVIQRLKENSIEVTEDNINNYKGKLFNSPEEELNWQKELLYAIQDEFITA